MPELPSDFWTGWIATITVVSLIGLGWLVYSVFFSPTRPVNKLGPSGTAISAKSSIPRPCGGSGSSWCRSSSPSST